MAIKIYLARAMTGRVKSQVLAEAKRDNRIIRKWGMIPLDPVTQEGIKAVPEVIAAPEDHLRKFWKRDKEMIREANVVFDMSPTMKSEGVAHEVAYARYFLWKPVIRVYPDFASVPNVSVAKIEDDFLAAGINEAASVALCEYGTIGQRIRWRLRLLRRCFWKFVRYQMEEFK